MQLSGSSYSKDIIDRANDPTIHPDLPGPKGYKYPNQGAVDCRNVWRIRILAA
jgi:hypothetical protein